MPLSMKSFLTRRANKQTQIKHGKDMNIQKSTSSSSCASSTTTTTTTKTMTTMPSKRGNKSRGRRAFLFRQNSKESVCSETTTSSALSASLSSSLSSLDLTASFQQSPQQQDQPLTPVKKCVSFRCNDSLEQIRIIPFTDLPTEQEKQQCFYSKTEMHRMNQHAMACVGHILEQHRFANGKQVCARGLEQLLEKFIREAGSGNSTTEQPLASRKSTIRAILEAQSNGGDVAKVSRTLSDNAVRRAIDLGTRDAAKAAKLYR